MDPQATDASPSVRRLRIALLESGSDATGLTESPAPQRAEEERGVTSTRLALVEAILRGWSVCCLYAQHPACRVAGCPCACHRVMERSAA